MRESEVKKLVKKKLKKAGWMWVDTSAPTRAYQGMIGAPDNFFFRANCTVCMEVKGESGRPTEGQILWREKIFPHLGPNLFHMFIYHPDQLPEWMLIDPIGP